MLFKLAEEWLGKSADEDMPESYHNKLYDLCSSFVKHKLQPITFKHPLPQCAQVELRCPARDLCNSSSVNMSTALTLLSHASAMYCPERSDCPHLLLAGSTIAGFPTDAQAAHLQASGLCTQVHVQNCVIVPGFIDMHVHMTGGGGEAGPASRCPEAQLSNFLDAGITTAVGVLGTDTITRSQENLVAKCKGLNASGISCYHWCGGYAVPCPTATGSIQRDMCLLDSCLGVGEVAVSDHRASVPSISHLANIASQARVGGMLSGKCGLVYCHMGAAKEGLQPLVDAVHSSDVPITQFLPTHVERTPQLITAGAKWLAAGGRVDLTCRTHQAQQAVTQYREARLPLENCTVASDGFGSWPVYDKQGHLLSYEVADLGAIHRFLVALVKQEGWDLAQALQFMTCNPATTLQLPHKGRIAAGMDADLLLLDKTSLEVQYVYAKGQLVRTPEWTHGGMFERGERIRPIKPQLHACKPADSSFKSCPVQLVSDSAVEPWLLVSQCKAGCE